MQDEKLQKVLARLGLGSRREIETWIKAGRLTINRQIAKLGDRVRLKDIVHLEGRLIPLRSFEKTELRVLMYHKPVGEICSRVDEEGRPTVFQTLPKLRSQRWISVGRLDVNTAGLLLFTTEGELANRLMHPSSEVEREYAVRLLGRVSDRQKEQLMKGIKLEDGLAKFDEIIDIGGEGANHWYHVILREGRNREVRRLFENLNLAVSRLIRVRFGPIALPRGLRLGKWRDLEKAEIQALCDQVGYALPQFSKRTISKRTTARTPKNKPKYSIRKK